MQTIIGATALAAGIVISLGTALMAATHPEAAARLLWVAGAIQVALIAVGLFLLLRSRGARWLAFAAAFAGGLIGFVLALVATSSGVFARGDELIDGKRVQTYELIVRLFGQVVYQEIGPAVQRSGREGTYTGPDERLDTLMLLAGWSMVAADVLLIALLGAVVGAGIRRLTVRSG